MTKGKEAERGGWAKSFQVVCLLVAVSAPRPTQG